MDANKNSRVSYGHSHLHGSPNLLSSVKSIGNCDSARGVDEVIRGPRGTKRVVGSHHVSGSETHL